jgi:hypothetical protein
MYFVSIHSSLLNNHTFIATSFWLWPLPIRPSTHGNGCSFTKIPDMNIRDINRMQDDGKIEEINEIESEESVNDLKDYFDNCSEEYKGKNLYMAGFPQCFMIQE